MFLYQERLDTALGLSVRWSEEDKRLVVPQGRHRSLPWIAKRFTYRFNANASPPHHSSLPYAFIIAFSKNFVNLFFSRTRRTQKRRKPK
jgi:hypothetical protein